MSGDTEHDSLVMLRHDINNQLSNIQLCLSELKHEEGCQSEDCKFYIETIQTACKKIEALLQNPER
ncbi:hypothetical protein DJ568_06165 [Mucilaginibacter hurinus]|uniref:Uncharacterized protein n=1 Tax=Mucilaginibacter hurinus TaxID=2201324 RepID=A0A367GQX1_9SPHI|nr:hypothetical protein [Mucilaginibacter hurinus]RCH55475.1 hypothetical protein DJ568_06165 [Mucilaginibacter hurinus]